MMSLRCVVWILLLLSVPSFLHAQERKTLRVVFTGLAWNSELPFRVALARGFFKAQGLDILPIFVRGGPAALAALSSGEVEFAEIGGAQAIMRSRARGLDVAILGTISNAVTYQLVGAKGMKSLEELRGKLIGVTGAGAFSDFATRVYLRRRSIDPDKDVILRAIGGSSLRVGALEKSIVAAAPFSPEDTVRLTRLGYPMLANFSDILNMPQTLITARGDYIDKQPDIAKRFLKGLVQGIHHAKTNKADSIRAGFESKLQGDPEIVQLAYDLFAPGFSADLSVNMAGLQFMLDEDKRNNLIDAKFTIERAVNDRLLKLAQQELRAEGKLK